MFNAVSASDSQWERKPGVSPVIHLAKMWAKKYVQRLDKPDDPSGNENIRENTVENLYNLLRITSVDAWSQTEKLIGQEIYRHEIDRSLVDPWQISQDSFAIYNKAIDSYAKGLPPENLARIIGGYLGKVRSSYTASDARVIGFVSMQIHYTGQMLLKKIPYSEREIVNTYFKVIDDYLYMPLQRAYEASAKHNPSSPVLQVVQQLLPISSDIARSICERVILIYPRYHTFSGSLADPVIKIASIRDVEMFQVYLWVCVLEDSIGSIQHELFPLCVMLYPALKVQWELVRTMIHLLRQEIGARLGDKQKALFKPYLEILWEMFSPDIFPDSF
jgi:Phycobilisome protein